MDRMLIKAFMEAVEAFDDKKYFLYKLMYHTAPTLAGLKPSSLMTFTNFKRKMPHLWDYYKEEICASLGVHYYELNRKEDRVIVLFYQQDALADCLAVGEHKLFLEKLGYPKAYTLQENLDQLRKRYEKSCPHEIGIFLGYPLEDVLSFMENQGRPCLVSQYWKVYKDAERAIQIFATYDEAREKVIRTVLELHPQFIPASETLAVV